MEAVLYICHGSRVKAGAEEAIEFIDKAKRKINALIQETCFLELAEPDIMTGVKSCVEQGATTISVVPILLLTAIHAKEDIPEEIDKMREMYPDIEFKYGRPFGIHTKIIDALLDRVLEQVAKPSDDAMVLLIGRGSSDPDVKRDLTKVADTLNELHEFKRVDTCYMYGATPKFEEGLQLAKSSGHKQVFIIPYLLFSGILMTEIKDRIQQVSGAQEILLCDSLGYHPNLVDVLVERATELLDEQLVLN